MVDYLFLTLADHVASEEDFSKALHRLGESAIERMEEPDEIGAAFKNFAVVTKEMANLMKNMVSSDGDYFDFKLKSAQFQAVVKYSQKVKPPSDQDTIAPAKVGRVA